ncbi:putative membrane protein, partial [Vibrio cholerae HC-68A1]
GD